jgi:hypothetical protein
VELKEIHILNNVLHDLLSEAAQNSLKLKIGSEKEYAKFLSALLEVVIGKNKSLPLKDILNLVGIAHIEPALLQKTNDIIEEIADQHFKGYNSEYTKWLQNTNNEIFSIHLAFIKETKSGIIQSERESLKSKLANIEKLDAFEFEENDIRSGIKLVERARIKEHFNQLYSQLRKAQVQSPKKSRFAILFSLVIVSSIVFAIVNPTVRHFIVEQYHKLIDKPHENEGATESTTQQVQALPSIADSTTVHSTDTIQEKSKQGDGKKGVIEKIKVKKDSLKKESKKTDNITSEIAHSSFDNADYGNNAEKVYENYFITNKKKLNPIEGFWLLNVKEKSNSVNSFKMKSAIVQIAKNKFELIHLNNEGTIEKLPYSMYFEFVSALEGYNFIIQLDNKTIFKSKATLQAKEGILLFESEYDARHFYPKNKEEMVKCKVSGYKKLK